LVDNLEIDIQLQKFFASKDFGRKAAEHWQNQSDRLLRKVDSPQRSEARDLSSARHKKKIKADEHFLSVRI